MSELAEATELLHEDLVRVYELPTVSPGGYRFGGGVGVTFMEVDWFRACPPPPIRAEGYADPRSEPDRWEHELREDLAQKNYMRPGRRYLVLCLHRSFVVQAGVERSGVVATSDPVEKYVDDQIRIMEKYGGTISTDKREAMIAEVRKVVAKSLRSGPRSR